MKLSAKNANIIHRSNVFAMSGLAKASLKFGASKSHTVQERIGFMLTSARAQPDSLGWINDRLLEIQTGAELIGRKPTMTEVTDSRAQLVMSPAKDIDEEQFQEYVLGNPQPFYQTMYWFARKYSKYAHDEDFHTVPSKMDIDKFAQQAMSADMQTIVEDWYASKQSQANVSGVIPSWIQEDVNTLIADADSVTQFINYLDLLEPTTIDALHLEMQESHRNLIKQQEEEKARLIAEGAELATTLFGDDVPEAKNDFKDTNVADLFAS